MADGDPLRMERAGALIFLRVVTQGGGHLHLAEQLESYLAHRVPEAQRAAERKTLERYVKLAFRSRRREGSPNDEEPSLRRFNQEQGSTRQWMDETLCSRQWWRMATPEDERYYARNHYEMFQFTPLRAEEGDRDYLCSRCWQAFSRLAAVGADEFT